MRVAPNPGDSDPGRRNLCLCKGFKDDWAEDHHDVEVQDEQGRVQRRERLPEGIAGIRAFGELIGRFVEDDTEFFDALVCIETDRGPWVQALLAAGYRVSASTRNRLRGTGRSSAVPAPQATKETHTLLPT